jgi:rhodanese-related sulfurtransferase
MRKLTIGIATLALVSCAHAAAEGPPVAVSGATTASASERLADFFGRTKGSTRIVPASEVWEGIHGGTNKYFVVDVRPAEDYAKGHVPGALSLPIDVLFLPASLAQLPPPGEKPLLLVCKTGHTESMALGALAALRWEPWVMRFGMVGWDAETKVKAGSASQEADTVHGVGGPIETSVWKR